MITTVLWGFLITSNAFAEGKHKPVVIDQKKVESQKPAASPNKKYASQVKDLLKQDLKSVDVHLADEGSLKWLFIVVSYPEWKAMSKDSRRELVELLCRISPNLTTQISPV